MIRFLMNRMSASNWTLAQDGTGFAFRRGFTGHEHYDRFGIIPDPADVRIVPPTPRMFVSYRWSGFAIQTH